MLITPVIWLAVPEVGITSRLKWLCPDLSWRTGRPGRWPGPPAWRPCSGWFPGAGAPCLSPILARGPPLPGTNPIARLIARQQAIGTQGMLQSGRLTASHRTALRCTELN
jgi:hypothetical protein